MENMMSFKDFVINEKDTLTEKLKEDVLQDIINSTQGKTTELLRIALQNREKANKDGRWQAEYFYGKNKKLSEENSKTIVDFMSSLKDWTTEEDLLKAILKKA